MTQNDIHNILIIGIDVVSLATSAAKAGYKVYTVDYFGDQDLKCVCDETLSIVRQAPGETCGQLATNFSPEALLHLTMELRKKNVIDGTLLSTGLDDSPDVLSELNDMIPIIGNHPHIIKRIRDKTKFFQELKRLDIPHPVTAMAENLEEARKTAKDIGYPILVKPSKGFGGVGIRKSRGPEELAQAFQDASRIDQNVLIQEYVSGTPASISLISSTTETITLTLNEQLLGVSEVGQEEPFGYCGNIVPFVASTAMVEKCVSVAEKITSNYGLVGSNGVDLVVSKEGLPYIVEVNPRFQATVECVERVLGINMAEAHMRTFIQGRLPSIAKRTAGFCTRLILFAPQRSVVPDLSVLEEVRDIPMPEVVIEKGEPVCSVVTEGADRNSSLRKARIISGSIYKSLKPRK